MTYDLLITGANIYCGNGKLLKSKDMAISDGKIVKIADKKKTEILSVLLMHQGK